MGPSPKGAGEVTGKAEGSKGDVEMGEMGGASAGGTLAKEGE
jgi:hypothetical protein